MDPSTIVIVGLFVFFGVLEYQKRENAHRQAIAWMRLGRNPPPAQEEQKLWRLLTTSAVIVALMGFIGLLGVLGLKGGKAETGPFLVVALTMVPPLVLLVLIVRRDFRKYSAHKRGRNEPAGDQP
jgi:hypothetical protein